MGNLFEDKQVLVVDDNEVNLMIARLMLQKFGLAVDAVNGGAAALEKVTEKEYHMIFMDHLMPEMDGGETTRRIRSCGMEYCKRVPVVALTASESYEAGEVLSRSEYDDYVAKPIKPERLEEVLKKYLTEQSGVSAESTKKSEVFFEGIDSAGAMEKMHLDEETYLSIVKNYYYDLSMALQRILAAKERGDIKGFVIDVHGIKSSSASIGATELSELAKALETAGKEDNTLYIDTHIEKFTNKCNRILQVLGEYFLEDVMALKEESWRIEDISEATEKKRILVVDDSITNLKFVESVLKDTYKLILVKSGKEALEYLKLHTVNLVLLDVLMPEMDGFETFQQIKLLETNQDVPVVFLTADSEVENEIKGLVMGAEDFIRKPFVPEVMKNRIEHILQLDELNKDLEKKVEEKTSQIEQLSFEIIATIASMLEAKDSYTKGHSMRVAEYSALLAETLGWKEDAVQNLKYVALLHDIGKVGIPDSVLNKPGKLTEMEFSIIKSHTSIGGDILKDIETIPDVDSGAKYHHEKYDGSGYPAGLAGNEIPAVARIIGIADAYDAMNSKRIYRDNMSPEVIRSELVKGRGKQFDPEYLDVFVKLLDSGRLNLPAADEAKSKTISGEGSQLIQQIMQNIEEESKRNEGKDSLTGLFSRKSGEARIMQVMRESQGCLAFIDLDNLKKTNDTMGHLAGDYALMTTGEVLSENVENAIVMRLGGDEFILFMVGVSQKEARERIEKIFEAFHERKSQSAYLSASDLSAGLCMTGKNDSYQDVYAKADKALYHVKQRGKSGYYFYRSSLTEVQKSTSADLSLLVSSLKQQGGYSGSLHVEYREFAKIYDFISHLTERYEHKMQLIMITMQPATTETFYIDEIEYAMSCMEKTIQDSLRSVDVCTRFSSEQFLVILMDAGTEAIEMISNRIFSNFTKVYNGKELLFDYDVAELPK